MAHAMQKIIRALSVRNAIGEDRMSQPAARAGIPPWMRLAPLIRSTFASVGAPPFHFPLPSTQDLLLEGGDTRILLDLLRGTNRYGCVPYPDPGMLAFGSSTASSISEDGFAAAERLRQRLLLGQPVACGVRHGTPVSALRICASARLAVEAVSRRCADEVIARALMVLEKAGRLASVIRSS